MKTNETNTFSALSLESWYQLACQWEEEPEIIDPWQRNTDI